MKTVAFVMSLVIIAVGAVGILAPPALVWIAQHSLTPVELYFIAAVRVAFGLLLISVASASRAPKTLRVVAFIPLVAGIAMPVVGIEGAQTVIEWWTQQGAGVVRLTAIPLLALEVSSCMPAPRLDALPNSAHSRRARELHAADAQAVRRMGDESGRETVIGEGCVRSTVLQRLATCS